MWLTLLLILSFACYRVTRFITRDTLIKEWRQRLGDWILGPVPRTWRDKLYELLHCPYCLGIWVSAGLVAATDWRMSVPMPVFTWLSVAGMAMLWWRSIESDDDSQ